MPYAYAVFDGEKNTFEDWGLMLSRVSISDPEPQIITTDIPGRNGPLDLSEVLTGYMTYKNRKIELEFDASSSYDEWPALRSKISNYLHGKNRKIIFDNDPEFYYYGRFTVDHQLSDEATATVVITGSVDPYKYDAELSEISLTGAGSKTATIYGSRMPVVPTITAATATTATFNGTTYAVAAGENLIPGVCLVEGENTLVFAGGGNITISYRGGSL